MNAKNRLGQQTRNRIQPDILSACRVTSDLGNPSAAADIKMAPTTARYGAIARYANLLFFVLPNVKSEPRPYMARAVRKHSP